jgi:carboxyl-terminal processing protease
MLPSFFLAAFMGVMSFQAPQPAPTDPLAISREEKVTVFEKLWNLVNKEFFDPKFSGVNWAATRETYRPQVDAAKNKENLRLVLQKMLDELHSSHLTVDLHLKFNKDRVAEEITRKVERKENLGFDPGLKLKNIDGRDVVESVMEESGAKLAGVERGWILVHWNDCQLDETVVLRFVDLQGQEKDLKVTCKLYPLPGGPPERSTQVLDGGVVYLRWSHFGGGTNDWLDHELEVNHDAPAVIVDLRGNGGGALPVLRKCLDPFFKDAAVIGEFRQRNNKEPKLKVSGRGKSAYAGRVVVLIDEYSASASEIFAAGIQETGRGIVVGRKSIGAVLGNLNYGLPNGFKVSIPIRGYQTAKGVRLEGRGVIPDAPVALTMKDFIERRDSDLARAKESLANAHPTL